MLKAFALIAVIYGADGDGHAYVIGENMTAATCIEVMADVAADGGWFDGDESTWRTRYSLNNGDVLQCEFIIGE